MTYSNVCILTEGGGDKGLGHVYRAITLASQLPGCRIHAPEPSTFKAAFDLVHNSGVPWGNGGSDYEVIIRDLCPGTPYPTRSPTTQLLVDVCDSTSESSGEADITFATYGSVTYSPKGQAHCVGLEYAILRQEFVGFSTLKERDTITICLGGVDPSNATAAISKAIKPVADEHNLRLQTIYGPGSKDTPPDVDPHTQPPVWEALSRSTLAIVSPGTTLLECAAMGVPALVLAHNEREEKRAKRMRDSGYQWFKYIGRASNAARSDSVTLLLLDTAVRKLLTPPTTTLDSMANQGNPPIDGCGAWRVGGRLRREIAHLDSPATTTSPATTSPSSSLRPIDTGWRR